MLFIINDSYLEFEYFEPTYTCIGQKWGIQGGPKLEVQKQNSSKSHQN